jgi:hypothetical protein
MGKDRKWLTAKCVKRSDNRLLEHFLKILVQVKGKKKKSPVHVLKAYGGGEVETHSILTSALDELEWLIHAPAAFPLTKKIT